LILNLSLRWRFRPGFFLAFRGSLGKRRNIPSGETACAGDGEKQAVIPVRAMREPGIHQPRQGVWIPRCAIADPRPAPRWRIPE
jgi:hypothetical protein